MRFVQDANVFNAEGEQVGSVDRVVLDPQTKEVSHIVVRKGLIFTEDKVIPISLVASATEERVTLREDAGDLDKLPQFQEAHYVEADEAEVEKTYPPMGGRLPPLYWYPPAHGTPYTAPMAYPDTPIPNYVVETTENIPEGTVALKEGAEVISGDGEHVGDVEQVLTDPEADRATHLVISEGLLLKERKLVPTTWISQVEENQVHLAVESSFLDGLRDYTG